MTPTGIGMDGELALDPRVNVVAMAQIVYDLCAGGLVRVQDMDWLRAHANAALLGRHEYEALQALGTQALGTRLKLGGAGDAATRRRSTT